MVLANAYWQAREMKIGDFGSGLLELREASPYNLDTAAITRNFSIGADMLTIVAQTHGLALACQDCEVMCAIDRFGEHMQEVDGVKSVISLTQIAKRVDLKWYGLPSDPRALAEVLRPLGAHSPLLNSDCSAMQIIVSMEDHLSDTISRTLRAAKALAVELNSPNHEFKLAGGNVRIMAATNEAIAAAENKMLAALFASISLLCLIAFRSIRATLCVVLSLALAALLCKAFMASFGIGLTLSTLPVIAFGIGIGVAMWSCADLKLQADMGILFAFMFLVSLVGALLLLPALAAWSLQASPRSATQDPD